MLKNAVIPFASAIAGGLVVLLAMPGPRPVPRTIRADRLILDGDDGLPRMIVSGGGERGASVILLDREAKPALTLAVPSEGHPSIGIGEGRGRIFLVSDPDGLATIVVKDREGKDRVRISVDAGGEAVIETVKVDGAVHPQVR